MICQGLFLYLFYINLDSKIINGRIKEGLRQQLEFQDNFRLDWPYLNISKLGIVLP